MVLLLYVVTLLTSKKTHMSFVSHNSNTQIQNHGSYELFSKDRQLWQMMINDVLVVKLKYLAAALCVSNIHTILASSWLDTNETKSSQQGVSLPKYTKRLKYRAEQGGI